MTADSIVFVWRGTDRNGQPSAGEEMASSAAMARAQLRKQGVTTKTVRKKAKELNNSNIEGIIVGKAIYDGDIKLEELVKELNA